MKGKTTLVVSLLVTSKDKKLSLPIYFPLCSCPKGQDFQGDNEELEFYLGLDVQRVF